MIERKQSFKDQGEEHSRKNSQCKGPRVRIDCRFSRDRKTSLAGVER